MTDKCHANILKNKEKRNDNKTSIAGYTERGGTIRREVIGNHENEPDLLRANIDNWPVLMADKGFIYYFATK